MNVPAWTDGVDRLRNKLPELVSDGKLTVNDARVIGYLIEKAGPESLGPLRFEILSEEEIARAKARLLDGQLKYPLRILPDRCSEDYETAIGLVRTALTIRMYGERAPGGNENWDDWGNAAEQFLRNLTV